MATENNGTFPTHTFSQNPTASPPLLSLPTVISSIPSPLSAFSRPSRLSHDHTPPSDPSLLLGGYTPQLHDLQRRPSMDGYSPSNRLLSEILTSQLLRAGSNQQQSHVAQPLVPSASQAEDVLAKIRQSLLPDKNSPSLTFRQSDYSTEKSEEESKSYDMAEPSSSQPEVHRIRRRRHSANGKKLTVKHPRAPSECSNDGGGGGTLKVPKQEPMPIPQSPANVEEEHEHQMGTPDDPHPDINSPPSVRLSSENGMANGNYASSCSRQSSSNNADAANNSGDDDGSMRHKMCRVCGDTATGYNFNVITCESCKAFFRRNALRPRNDFKCPYSDDCEINAVSRRFCQKCRLKKCFDVGMKKEWILTEDQLRRRKNSRLNNLKTIQHSSPRPRSLFEEDSDRKRESFSKMMPGLMPVKKERISPLEQRPPPISDLRITPVSISSGSIQLPPSLNPSEFVSTAAGLGFQRRNTIDVPPQQSSLLNPGIGISSPNVLLTNSIPKPIGLFTPEIEAMRNNLVGQAAVDDAYEPLFLRLNQLQPPTNNVHPTGVTQPRPQLPPQPPPLPSFPSSIETVVTNKGESKVALSLEEYQKLVKAAASATPTATPATPAVISEPTTSTSGLDPLYAAKQIHSMLQQQPNLLSGLSGFGGAPPDLSRIIGMANVELMNAASTNSPYASNSQQTSPGMPFTPDSIRKWRYMENIIHDALAESPDGSDTSPEAPAVVDRELTYYQEIASNQAATNPHNSKYHLSPLDVKELDIVKSAFACMDEPIDMNSKEAATLKKKEHDPTDIMNIMDISMKRFVKMAKRLPPFLQMAQESKLALLRSSMIDMLSIRGVTRLDSAHRQWKTPVLGDATISFDMFDKLNDNQQKGRFLHFYRALHDKIRPDTTAINLIALLVLFDCSRANLASEMDKKTSIENQQKYYYLLKKYFESLYGDEAQVILHTVPGAISILRVVSTNAATLFLGRVNSNDTENLVKEFFPLDKDKAKSTATTPTGGPEKTRFTATTPTSGPDSSKME